MFNKDFYPTPKEVVQRMIGQLDLQNAIIYEPSAGKGDIIDVLRAFSPKEILASESHPELADMASKKADRWMGNDCMQVTSTDIPHVTHIFMNPPFSADEKHILHMWDIAPEGCIIVALCNWETINTRNSRRRNKLELTARDYGSYENLGSVFDNAERKTDVEVGLITLHKPKEQGDNEFEGYFDMDEDVAATEAGTVSYSFTRDIVGRYIMAVQKFDEVQRANEEIMSIIKPMNSKGKISFGATIREGVYHDSRHIDATRENFKKFLQRDAWATIFSKLDMDKYVTESVRKDINKFIELQSNVPFTVRNIQKMIEIVVGTSNSRKKVHYGGV